MKKYIIYGVIACVAAGMATEAQAQKWAIKGYDNIGVGKSMSFSESMSGQSSKSSYNQFGLDLGYKFWEKNSMWLECNVGVGYSFAAANFSIDNMSYDYAAPAYADEDGNPYQRYYELKNLRQKIQTCYVNVPIYLEYQYKPVNWLGIYADLGVQLAFRSSSRVGKMEGSATAYGIFPEYDDLLIDADYLDDFGTRNLSNAKTGDITSKGFNASLLVGAGFEFYAYEPVSFNLGVRYNAGFTQVFGGQYDMKNGGNFTAENAPVTYTVADGTVVKALSDYTSKSKLSPLSIHVGVTVRF